MQEQDKRLSQKSNTQKKERLSTPGFIVPKNITVESGPAQDIINQDINPQWGHQQD
jgi:hypothetical protein